MIQNKILLIILKTFILLIFFSLLFLVVTSIASCNYYYSERAARLKIKDHNVICDLPDRVCYFCDVCDQKDTTTPMGTKIHYTRVNEKYQISWGNDSYQRKYDSLFECFYDRHCGLWDYVPKFWYETKSNLVLIKLLWASGGCNPAAIAEAALILPKNNTDSIYIKDLFRSCIGNYMVYADDDDLDKIHVINLESKKMQTMILKPTPLYYRAPGMAIHSLKIVDGVLNFKYDSFDQVKDIDIVVSRKIKMNI